MGTCLARVSQATVLPPQDRVEILPEFYGSCFEGYAVNYLNKNFWRVATSFGDFEDALSESCVVYYECRRLYGSKVKNLKHFMALYKTMMHSWFTDWSNYDTRCRNVLAEYPKVKSEIDYSDANLNSILAEASIELKEVLKTILNAPAETIKILRDDASRGADAFFKKAAELCNIDSEKTMVLQEELISILS